MLFNIKINDTKLLAEVLADYLHLVGNDADRKEQIEYAQRLKIEVETKLSGLPSQQKFRRYR